jgi:hypothetical protein
MVCFAKIQINLWSDDSAIPLMVRVASKPDGSMMSKVTGPSAVVEVMMVEDQANTYQVTGQFPAISASLFGLNSARKLDKMARDLNPLTGG